ncbi:MAG: acyltransferase [Bacteroidota bacterium]
MKSSPPLSTEQRIEILDGFRAMAVMAVIAYHYFFFFGKSEDLSDYPVWELVRRGYFGVHLFFIISGFVIYRSMDQSTSIKEFLGKRYLRLAPSLIVASIFTYAMVEWWNSSNRIEIYQVNSSFDFLFSLTFIHPDVWNGLFGRTDIKFIDGAYWSLWPEVVFYISASIVYFNSRRENFLRNWFFLVLIANILRIATSPKLVEFTPEFLLPVSKAYYGSFLLLNLSYWPYFTTGMLFYALWTKRNPSQLVWIIAAVVFMFEMYFIEHRDIRILFIAAIGLWMIFLRRPSWLQFLQWRPIQVIGLISYPLYLLHETAGLVLTEKLITWTNHSVPVPVLLLITWAVFIVLAYCVFLFFEKPITRALKKRLLGLK